MIIAILFLILFAILLPGLMRFIFATVGLFIIALFMIAAAHAEPGPFTADRPPPEDIWIPCSYNILELCETIAESYDSRKLSKYGFYNPKRDNLIICLPNAKNCPNPNEGRRWPKEVPNPKGDPALNAWHDLDVECRGGSGGLAETNAACERRNGVDKILEARGCQFLYPDGWPSLGGEYWKCPK